MPRPLLFVLLVAAAWLTGCSTYQPQGAPSTWTGTNFPRPRLLLTAEQEERVLALDPEHVTARDVSEILSNLPAPRVVNIHGGIYPVHLAMKSFSRFLMGMGYPEASIRNPGNGDYSFSCYESGDKIAGAVAWYYEHEPLRPVIVGHSQGGMQAVKVLYRLAGDSGTNVLVWSPMVRKYESRAFVLDPLSGVPVPVVSLRLPYVSAVGSGGLTRLLPNQWSMMARLRRIPDSVEDFTGYYMGFDLFGGDLLGFGGANEYVSLGTARVRNVRLPTGYNHVTVPTTRHLLKSEQIKNWINSYQPSDTPRLDTKFDRDSSHILWAADVWHSLKQHWVQELQRVIRAQRAQTTQHGN